MSEQGKRALRLKGVETQEDTQDAVAPEQILELFRKRKTIKPDKPEEFDDLELEWNSNGTLSRMVAFRTGSPRQRLYELHFAWNANGSLNKIIRK